MSSNSNKIVLEFRPDELLLLRAALRIGRNTAMMCGSPGSQDAIEDMLRRLRETMADFPEREGSSQTYALSDLLRAAATASVVAISHPEPERHMPPHVLVEVDGTRHAVRADSDRKGVPARAAEIATLLHRFAPVECEVLLQTEVDLEVRAAERPGRDLPSETLARIVRTRLDGALGAGCGDVCAILKHDGWWWGASEGCHRSSLSILLPVARRTAASAALAAGSSLDEDLLTADVAAAPSF